MAQNCKCNIQNSPIRTKWMWQTEEIAKRNNDCYPLVWLKQISSSLVKSSHSLCELDRQAYCKRHFAYQMCTWLAGFSVHIFFPVVLFVSCWSFESKYFESLFVFQQTLWNQYMQSMAMHTVLIQISWHCLIYICVCILSLFVFVFNDNMHSAHTFCICGVSAGVRACLCLCIYTSSHENEEKLCRWIWNGIKLQLHTQTHMKWNVVYNVIFPVCIPVC